MKISIIVPFFNDKPYIRGCIESIKAQLYCDFEAILVDDCGSDGSSAEAIEAIGGDDRFKIVVHLKNRGLSDARNSGIEEATGDFIFFLDADDKLAFDEALHEMTNKCELMQIVQGDFVRSNGQIVCGLGNWTNATNKLINLKWLKDNNLYFIEGIIYEDVPWALKAYTLAKNVAHVDCATYFHNLRQGSISRSHFSTAKVESLLIILNELMTYKRDRYLNNRIVYYAMFLLKNLLMGDFEKQYKRLKYRQLKDSGAWNVEFNRSILTRFSKLLSIFRRNFLISNLLCATYKKMKR